MPNKMNVDLQVGCVTATVKCKMQMSKVRHAKEGMLVVWTLLLEGRGVCRTNARKAEGVPSSWIEEIGKEPSVRPNAAKRRRLNLLHQN